MRLIYNNLAQDSATTVTASSENTYFPASNLQHQFRSKTWRSAGTFVVDATNNKIDFKESGGGPELTATISSGTYSVSGLSTEIKTQLEAVGAATYTISYGDTTGKWTVANDGAHLSLLCGTGTNIATCLLTESLGFTATDKTGSVTYTGSNIAIHTKESIVFDMITTEDINSIVLLWPKEDGIGLSETAVLKVQANATDAWTSPSVSQTLTINNDYSIATHYFSTNQEYRYWRITIEDPANANLFVDLGVVILGTHLDIQEPENGFKYTLKDNSKVSITDYGNQYVDEYPQSAILSFNYKYMDYADIVLLENAFRTNGNRIPVFVTLDEDDDVFDKDHYAIYGKFNGSFTNDHVMYTYLDTDLQIVEIA
jgi:hypothetical protein